jgi:type I restriction enzyme M protein
MTDILREILRDSNYNLTIFNKKEIDELRKQANFKLDKQKKKYYVKCLIRDKDILLKPEEIVRQLYLLKLLKYYKYPKEKIRLEYPINFGREVKYADIVVFDKDRQNVV